MRFGCDGRDATTIYFDLHQRTLRYEVYFLPDPPRNHLELYRFLLQRNHTMYGARFSIGPDGDVYLVGRVALEHLTTEELDRIIGVLYELVEQWFQPAVRAGLPRRPDGRRRPAPESSGSADLRDHVRRVSECLCRPRRGPARGPEVQEVRSRSGKCGSGPMVPRAHSRAAADTADRARVVDR